MKSLFEIAVREINRKGFLLVFPVKNAAAPDSLWQTLYPNVPMRWEWDDSGDNRVVDLWHLREKLASSREVIYGKYFRGRATLFSRAIFCDLLTVVRPFDCKFKHRESKTILELLKMDSPLSTKQIKEATDLRGAFAQAPYDRAMRELWSTLNIVAVGEIADGAFPSLAHSCTQYEFEELWQKSLGADVAESWQRLCDLPDFETLEKYFLRGLTES